MARFRATIKGQRGETSRLGSARSGIETTTNGWDSGVRVSGHQAPGSVYDQFQIVATHGSSGRTSHENPEFLIGWVGDVGGFQPSRELRERIEFEYRERIARAQANGLHEQARKHTERVNDLARDIARSGGVAREITGPGLERRVVPA